MKNGTRIDGDDIRVWEEPATSWLFCIWTAGTPTRMVGALGVLGGGMALRDDTFGYCWWCTGGGDVAYMTKGASSATT
jgi:hypothetical protein